MLPPLFFSVCLPTWLAMFWRRSIRREAVSRGARQEPRSYIVFRLDALGDVVLTTPLFRALKVARPRGRLTVVVQPHIKPLLVTNPHIDEILTLPETRPLWLPKRLQRLKAATVFYWTQLRSRHFEFAVSPRWDVDEHLATFLCALTNAKHRVGFSCATTPTKRQMNPGFDRAYDICLPPGPVCHEVLRNMAVAERLAGAVLPDNLEIHITERDRRKAAKRLANVKPGTILIAIGIGAQSAGRRWPIEHFAETTNRIGETRNVQPLIVCSDSELSEALRLSAILRTAPVIVSGAMLREVCALLERCELFIGNDSGCAHLAAAVECSSVIISRHPRNGDPNHFNSPVRFAPRAPHVQVLQPAAGRDVCREACVQPGPHCILNVSAKDVTAAALQMLDCQAAGASRRVSRQMPSLPPHLLHTHSAAAMRRALESMRPGQDWPSL